MTLAPAASVRYARRTAEQGCHGATVISPNGEIPADHAVALSLSVTHKGISFDRRMPDVDFDALHLPDRHAACGCAGR